MHIILLRHAESARNKLLHDGQTDKLHTVSLNSSITDRGKRQAACCGVILNRALNSNPDNQIWCSTLDRTSQTLSATGVDMERVVFKPGLNEWNKESKEPFESFISRVDSLICELYDVYNTGRVDTVVIAGHSLYFSMLTTRIVSNMKNDHLVSEFPNCSLSSLCIKDDQFAIYNLGDVSHIPRDLQTGVHKPW
jgi:broad specificity phosphatase PhoE